MTEGGKVSIHIDDLPSYLFGDDFDFDGKERDFLERTLSNMRLAIKRDLPEVRLCKRHAHTLSVAAGGPSLEDTVGELDGYIVAVNGSQKWLKDRGVLPDACGICDPSEHMADIIDVDRRVRYFVSSTCHPAVFDKLKDCRVELWHSSGAEGAEEICRENNSDDWLMIGGGCTMGLRWINLGYILGFRRFHLHGMDSSFRDSGTHAYSDRRDGDGEPILILDGFKTRANFLGQLADFRILLERYLAPDIEPVAIEVFGDGLLQTRWREYRTRYPDAYRC